MIIIIFSFFIYFFTFFSINWVLKNKKIKFYEIPELKINKNYIYFNSNKIHRIYVCKAKLMVIDKNAYIKRNNIMITINNVTDIQLVDDFLYFKSLNTTKIIFNTKNFYRYFNILIISNKFSLKKLKQKALKDVINHLFCIESCKFLKKYLNFITNILEIEINDKKILVKKNKYNLSYDLFYKVNNIVKHLKVEETI